MNRILSPAESRRRLIKRFTDGVGGRVHFEYVTTRVPVALYRRIDSFAAAQSCKRAEALRILIERGLGPPRS